MKQEFTKELGQASYNAHREELLKGIYPDIAYEVPGHTTFFEWNEMPVSPDDELAIKTLYNKQGEAAVKAFFLHVTWNGTPTALEALNVILKEMEQTLFTDLERANMQTGEY